MADSTQPLWVPSEMRIADSELARFEAFVIARTGKHFDSYEALWRWSTEALETFWSLLWDFAGLAPRDPEAPVLHSTAMPGAEWFPGARLNYMDAIMRHADRPEPVVICEHESGDVETLERSEWQRQVAALAATLVDLGVGPGDRVVAYLHNTPQCLIAFHATASIGAIWSVAAPDLGAKGVLDRFEQIEPKVLIATDGYDYGGKTFDRSEIVNSMVEGLPTLKALVRVPATDCRAARPAQVPVLDWPDAIRGDAPLHPTAVDFAHPLWVVYSSGTTGKPKAIVHSHGGVLLEHIKQMSLQMDIRAGDRFMWFSSTAWMMWNYNIAAALVGATICIYDGNPVKPDLGRLWSVIERHRIRAFGAGAAWFESCRNAGLVPSETYDLSILDALGSTGSPLLPEVFDWIYDSVKADVYLASISGGTDFATACVGGAVSVPVVSGEISCRSLGCAVEAFDPAGVSVVDTVGELVITKPMPSMPIGFWGDSDNQRYLESYFDTYPGVWRHGDWIRITERGSAVIYGRSDATINRHGIRMGTSEIYRVVESIDGIADSLVVDLEFLGRESLLPLFVVLDPGVELTETLVGEVKTAVRSGLSPRHVPDVIHEINEVPRTFSGKKMEIPVRRVLLGQAGAEGINRETMANPDSIDWFLAAAANGLLDRGRQ
ncbi:MAG: acetoacetate--CoA ligase [Pseudomonadota bacterium]